MSLADVESASNEQLKTKVMELQAAVQEAKMSAAHHKLQYQMLSQESAAALECMKMEASMSEQENRIIHKAEHARAATTPVQTLQEGTIPVHKELYQRMCRHIQLLRESNNSLTAQFEQQQQYVERQDDEIASLTDKVDLMRQRIHAHREQAQKYRQPHTSRHMEGTPRSVYSTPQHIRSHAATQRQPQPFAALLQASEMASQESARTAAGRGSSSKKGHTRNANSMSSLPSTPHRSQRVQQPFYHTPSGRHQPLKVPSTATMPRTSALRTPDVYSQQSLPVPQQQGPPSDGTVSASDNDYDSEAETDIIEQDDEVPESEASRSASQMLRTSQEEQQAKRESFKGSGMLPPKTDSMRQTKLFGQVRKAGVDRSDGPPAKRARTSEGVGLGIAGAGVRD